LTINWSLYQKGLNLTLQNNAHVFAVNHREVWKRSMTSVAWKFVDCIMLGRSIHRLPARFIIALGQIANQKQNSDQGSATCLQKKQAGGQGFY
jgi:hypothetical protein